MQNYNNNPYTNPYSRSQYGSSNNSYYSQSSFNNQFNNVDNLNDNRYFTYNPDDEKPIMDVKKRKNIDFSSGESQSSDDEDTEEEDGSSVTDTEEEDESEEKENVEEESFKKIKEENNIKEEDIENEDEFNERLSMRNNQKVEIVMEEMEDMEQELRSIFPDFDHVLPSFASKKKEILNKKTLKKELGGKKEVPKPSKKVEPMQKKISKTSENFRTGNSRDDQSLMSVRSTDSKASERREKFMRFRNNYFGSVKSEMKYRGVEDVSRKFMR